MDELNIDIAKGSNGKPSILAKRRRQIKNYRRGFLTNSMVETTRASEDLSL